MKLRVTMWGKFTCLEIALINFLDKRDKKLNNIAVPFVFDK